MELDEKVFIMDSTVKDHIIKHDADTAGMGVIVHVTREMEKDVLLRHALGELNLPHRSTIDDAKKFTPSLRKIKIEVGK